MFSFSTAPSIKIWAAPCESVSSGECGQQGPWSDCASAQSDQGLYCPLSESMDTTECMNGEQRPRWYFAQAQDDLNLCSKALFHLKRPSLFKSISCPEKLTCTIIRKTHFCSEAFSCTTEFQTETSSFLTTILSQSLKSYKNIDFLFPFYKYTAV